MKIIIIHMQYGCKSPKIRDCSGCRLLQSLQRYLFNADNVYENSKIMYSLVDNMLFTVRIGRSQV